MPNQMTKEQMVTRVKIVAFIFFGLAGYYFTKYGWDFSSDNPLREALLPMMIGMLIALVYFGKGLGKFNN